MEFTMNLPTLPIEHTNSTYFSSIPPSFLLSILSNMDVFTNAEAPKSYYLEICMEVSLDGHS